MEPGNESVEWNLGMRLENATWNLGMIKGAVQHNCIHAGHNM